MTPPTGNAAPSQRITFSNRPIHCIFTPALIAPSSSHAVNGSQVTLSATDTGGSGLSRIRYHVNGGGWETYSTPFTISAGDSVEYYAKDIAGNEEEPRNSFDTAVPGDANHDGGVDDDDLSLLLASWGEDVGWGNGNFNGDDTVDDDDLSLLLASWSGNG